MIAPPFHPCPMCYRTVNEQPGAINPNCPNRHCPEGLHIAVPFLLSDTFLIRATFCMVLFVFMIMASWYVVEIFGATQ